MDVLKLAAFSHNGKGGNPAGVTFYNAMASDEEMLKVAKEVGYAGYWLAGQKHIHDFAGRRYGCTIPFGGEIQPECWRKRGSQRRDATYIR